MVSHLTWQYRWSVISLTSFLSLFSMLFSSNVSAENQSDNNQQGWPTRRVGGGSRNPYCGLEEIENGSVRQCRPLIALIREGLALTTQTLPSLWFYIPQVKNSNQIMIEFVLRDESDQEVYEATFKPTQQGGLTSFQLTQTQTFKGLEPGKSYHWYFSLIYEPQDRSRDEVVEGWIQRVPLSSDLAQQLAQATPIEQVQIYKNANLWPEAIATMASLKQTQPKDLTVSQMWKQLVASLNLPVWPTDIFDGQQRGFATAYQKHGQGKPRL